MTGNQELATGDREWAGGHTDTTLRGSRQRGSDALEKEEIGPKEVRGLKHEDTLGCDHHT